MKQNSRKQTSPVITIDGPSGSGKGTIAQILAQKLGWHLLDSGAIYRVLAIAIQKKEIDPNDELTVTNLAVNLDVEFNLTSVDKKLHILLENKDITNEIRTEQIGNIASTIATHPQVRHALLDRQRSFCQKPGLIADGRDMGTTVFPNAEIKIYLTANREERAKRRQKQLLEKSINVKLADLIEELSVRDARDEQRSASPLKPADDAIVIDTSNLSIEEVVLRIWEIIPENWASDANDVTN